MSKRDDIARLIRENTKPAGESDTVTINGDGNIVGDNNTVIDSATQAHRSAPPAGEPKPRSTAAGRK